MKRSAGRFRAIVYGQPHSSGQYLWTFEVWDRGTHRLAVTDNTCDWALMLTDARKAVRDLETAVLRGYYAPPEWLKGRRCPCPARHDD